MCENLFSRLNEGIVAIRSGRACLISHKAAQVVPVNVILDEPPSYMK